MDASWQRNILPRGSAFLLPEHRSAAKKTFLTVDGDYGMQDYAILVDDDANPRKPVTALPSATDAELRGSFSQILRYNCLAQIVHLPALIRTSESDLYRARRYSRAEDGTKILEILPDHEVHWTWQQTMGEAAARAEMDSGWASSRRVSETDSERAGRGATMPLALDDKNVMLMARQQDGGAAARRLAFLSLASQHAVQRR